MNGNEALAEDSEKHDALLSAAFSCKMVARKKHAAPPDPHTATVLRQLDGMDIVKKAASRKGRCLMLFNCQLSPQPRAVLGELTRMDSQSPVLYMHFPDGRMKFEGILVYPKSKYMVLKLGGGRHIACEDVFEAMVVFSNAYWIGTKAENPREEPLPTPSSLQNADDAGGLPAFGARLAVTTRSGRRRDRRATGRQTGKRKVARSESSSGDSAETSNGDSDSSAEDCGDVGSLDGNSPRRPARPKRKRSSAAPASSAGNGASWTSAEEQQASMPGSARRKLAAPGRQRRVRPRGSAAPHAESADDSHQGERSQPHESVDGAMASSQRADGDLRKGAMARPRRASASKCEP